MADLRRAAETGNPTLGRTGIDQTLRRPTVALTRPVIDEAGTVRAVLVAALDLGQLERAVVESPLPAGSAMMLIDGNGVILSHHPQPERWTGELLDDPLKPLLARPVSGLVDTPWLDGVASLVLFEPLAREVARAADATIVIALPRHAVFRGADRLFALELAGLGLLSLAGLVCGALIMDRLVARPAQGLLRVIRSLNAGDVRARMRRGDERAGLVGRLARSINALGRRLEEHQQAARHLEEQLRLERAARLLVPPPSWPWPTTPSRSRTRRRAGRGSSPPSRPRWRRPSPARSTAGGCARPPSRTPRIPASCGCRRRTPTRWSGSPTRCASGVAARCSPASRVAARRCSPARSCSGWRPAATRSRC